MSCVVPFMRVELICFLEIPLELETNKRRLSCPGEIGRNEVLFVAREGDLDEEGKCNC